LLIALNGRSASPGEDGQADKKPVTMRRAAKRAGQIQDGNFLFYSSQREEMTRAHSALTTALQLKSWVILCSECNHMYIMLHEHQMYNGHVLFGGIVFITKPQDYFLSH
jgi:hypothetical protein